MKPYLGGLIAVLWLALSPAAHAAQSCPAVLDHQFPRLQDEEQHSLCQYAGKVVLVVNTASYCGFTNQYDGLERLNERYRDRGLVVIGFPSNDFNQEPGSNAEIAEFCRSTYGVRFPMFARSSVAGPHAHPFYVRLAELGGGPPKWNFHKYLIDRSGTRVMGFPTRLDPESPTMVDAIESLLTATP